MTPKDTINDIKKAKKKLSKAQKLKCTCTPKELFFRDECTCLRGQELLIANTELWGIIAVI